MNSPLPDPRKTIKSQELTVLLAMCIFGEARSETPDARAGVGNVIKNRVLAGIYPGGDSWEKVITAPLQFSCFNQNDPNRVKIMEPLKHETQETWDSCYSIAKAILEGSGKDNTKRATHYFDKSMDARPPYWAKAFIHTVDIGRLRFWQDPRAFIPPTDIGTTAILEG